MAEYLLDLTQHSWPLWTDGREGKLCFVSINGGAKTYYDAKLDPMFGNGLDAVKMTVEPHPDRAMLAYIIDVISEAANMPVHIF